MRLAVSGSNAGRLGPISTRRLRPIRVRPGGSGLLEQAAGGVQSPTARRWRAPASPAIRAPKGRESSRTAGEPTRCLRRAQPRPGAGGHADRTAPRFTHADRLTALADSQARYARRGVTGLLRGHGVAPAAVGVPEATDASVAAPRVPHREPDVGAAEPPGERPRGAAGPAPGAGDIGCRGRHLAHYGGDPTWHASFHPRSPTRAGAGFVESANSLEPSVSRRMAARTACASTRWSAEPRPGLDVWERIAQSTPIADLRWVGREFDAATGDQLARLKRAGAAATTNPISYLCVRPLKSPQLGVEPTLSASSQSRAPASALRARHTTSRPTPGWRSCCRGPIRHGVG